MDHLKYKFAVVTTCDLMIFYLYVTAYMALVDILQIFLIYSKVQRNAILFPTNLSWPNK